MRHLASVFLLLVVLAAGCSPQVAPAPTGKQPDKAVQMPVKPANPDHPKLQGEWMAMSGEFQGQKMDGGIIQDIRWNFTEDKVKVKQMGQTFEATYKFNSEPRPKTFELKGDGVDIKGIYELMDDRMRVCFASTERPKEFKTAGTSQDTLYFTFMRVRQKSGK